MVNRMILQGRLCADPEMRRTQNGTAVCSFRVTWSETVKDRETKLFLNCVAWKGGGGSSTTIGSIPTVIAVPTTT